MKEIQILNNGDALYDIRRKINENFELMGQEVENGGNPLTKFGVNEGNETNGVADLIDITDDTLNFKVGGEYPNLVMTSGDGVTTKIESVNPLHLQNLADGEYKVVVDGSNSNITDAEFYSQLLEPENPNVGDVWFNGELASYLTTGERSIKTIANGNLNFTCMDSTGDLIVAAGQSNKILVSNDNMKTLSLIDVTTDSVNYSVIGCAAYNNKIYLVGNDGSVRYIDTSLQITQAPSMLAAIQPTRLRKVNNKFVALGATGNIAYTDNMEAWATQLVASPSNLLDITYRDGSYYILNGNGNIFTSQTITSWAAIQPQAQGGRCLKLYGDNILIGCQNGVLKIMSKQLVITDRTMDIKGQIKDMSILDDGSLLMVGDQNLCYTTSDLENFTLIQVAGGDLRHIHKDYIVGANGYVLQLITARNWLPYTYIPVGEVIISGGEVTYFTTYPYNTNGLFDATSSTFGLLRTAAEPDELNCHCQDAVLTPANLYSLNNYRTMNTSYEVDDKVGCPYHHNLQLKCVQAGTTSNEALDTKGDLAPGAQIEDGSVIWTVEELGTGGSGSSGNSGFNLFDTKISDHILEGRAANGWALQGTYVSGEVYPDFYAKVLEEKEAATPTEVTLGDSIITMYIASNGHQYYDIANKDIVDNWFNTYGTAWFYGIDTENERIFLPRDKYFAINGIAPVVGNGMTLGLTDGTTGFGLKNFPTYYITSGSENIEVGTSSANIDVADNVAIGVTTDQTKSGIEAHLESNEDKYLYICVGNTIVNQDKIDASKVLSEAVLRSSLVKVETVIETYVNGTSWYRIWSDGWCEQGGYYVPTATLGTITLLKSYKNIDYSITTGGTRTSNDNMYMPTVGVTKTVSNFSIYCGTTVYSIYWQASGYIW